MKEEYVDLRANYLFKFKPISTVEDIIRLVDIVNDSKIYCPTYKELNDPLEGQVISIGLEGYCGMWYSEAIDEEDALLRDKREKFRILALSDRCDISQLWAHYANGYKGVCLCFSTKGVFERAQRVEYCNDVEALHVNSDAEITRAIKKGFLKKQSGWSYEREWRIIQKNKFLRFDRDDLAGIVFGHELSKKTIDLIVKNTRDDIFLCKTYIGKRTLKVHEIPLDYSLPSDGSLIKYLDIDKSLATRKNISEKANQVKNSGEKKEWDGKKIDNSVKAYNTALGNKDALACPRCGAPMIIRTVKKGANKGKQFYGCSKFPECFGRRQMS